MTNQDKIDIQKIFGAAEEKIQKIVTSVIDAEHLKIHLKNPQGIKNDIVDIVKEVIK